MSAEIQQFAFGPFRLDPANHLLVRGLDPVPLAPKAFDTLVYLVENSRTLVTREELMQAIWPDSFVEDANLTVNISLLRKALGDRSDGRPYIETVPRKGYRFNAEITRVSAGARTGPVGGREALPDDGPQGRPERATSMMPASDRGSNRSHEAVARQPAEPAVITFPDAKRAPVEMTSAIQPEPARPAETAEGKTVPRDGHRVTWAIVAILVILGALAVWRFRHRPATVQQLQRRRLTSFAPELAVTADAVSTGGKFIAYGNPNGLFIQVIATGETHALALPSPHFNVSSISWFPDSARLLVGGSGPDDDAESLWIVPVIGTGPTVKVGFYAAGEVPPDGNEIAVLGKSGNAQEIDIMPSEGGTVRTIAVEKSGETFQGLAWSRDGERVLFTRLRWDPQRRRNSGSIESFDLAAGKTLTVVSGPDLGGDLAAVSAHRLVYSRILGVNPAANGSELMVVGTDPQTGRAVGAPAVLAKWDLPITGLSSNNGGTRLVLRDLSAEHDVYVGELRQNPDTVANVRRFSFGVGREDFSRAWAPDSRTFFIDSNRNGNWESFKQSLDEVSEEPFVQGPGDQFSPRLSPDGQWLLYLDRPSNWQEPEPVTLMRVPISGGLPRVVLKASGIGEWGLRFECPRRAGLPCVLAEQHGQEAVFMAFDPATGLDPAPREIARRSFDAANPVNWALSSDGSQLAWPEWNTSGGRIHVLPLSMGPHGLVAASEPILAIPKWSHLRTIAPTPNGRGRFVTSQRPASWTLLHVDSHGSASALLKINNTYAADVFPSPDGRPIAFAERNFGSNVWMMERF